MGKNTVKANSTAVSVSSKFTQADVPTLLEQVNAKIKELKGEESESVRITTGLGPFGLISSIKDPGVLIAACSYIRKKAAAYKELVPEFQDMVKSCKIPAFKEGGHSEEAWEKEIKLQFRSATFEAEIQKLTQIKTELESCLSEDMKLAAKLANISDLLTQ